MSRSFLRSVGYSFSTGARLPIDLSFLSGAKAGMKAPEIEGFVLNVTGSTAAGSAAIPGSDLCRMFDAVRVRDRGGDRCNLSGPELRVANQLETGEGSPDPTGAPAGGGAFAFTLRVPFMPNKARRRADYRLALAEITQGGEITLNCTSGAVFPGATIASATIVVYALVVDGGAPEAKSRLCWLGYNATQAEDYYSTNGAIRAAFVVASDPNGGLTPNTATSLDSTTLDYVDVDRSVLVDTYAREGDPSANDAFRGGFAFPIVTPNEDQKALTMVASQRLHLRFPAAPPANSRVIVCTITDRVAGSTRAVLGPSPDPAAARLSTPKGKRAPSRLGQKAAAILPVRIAK